MPHDMWGRRLRPGDYVKTVPYNTHARVPVIARIVEIKEEQSCSGKIAWPSIGEMSTDYFGAGSSELVLQANGDEPGLPLKLPEVGKKVRFREQNLDCVEAEVTVMHSKRIVNLRLEDGTEHTSVERGEGIGQWEFID